MTTNLYDIGVAIEPQYWRLMRAYVVHDGDESTHMVEAEPIRNCLYEGKQLYRIAPYDARKILGLRLHEAQ